MISFLFKLYHLAGIKLWQPVGYTLGIIYLYGKGVSFGARLKTYGVPTVSLCKGSIIKLGSDAVLRSESRGNAIGVNHEVIMRTSTKSAKIIIGNNFRMSGGAICAVNKIEIGNNVLLGSNVVIADNDFHGMTVDTRSTPSNQLVSKPVKIEDGVWVGADVYLCKGVNIGRNSVIGAKAVVTKSIPENSIAAGVPAIVIGYVG